MSLPGESEFLDSKYEQHIFTSTQEILTKWLPEECTTADELEINLRSKTEGVVGRIFGAEQVLDGNITLFAEYTPSLYKHPVQVFGKPVKGMPDYKLLREFAVKGEQNGLSSRPLVLMHDSGIYITCVSVSASRISAEILERNLIILNGKASDNWNGILKPKNTSLHHTGFFRAGEYKNYPD
jgi:hypothetical protein